MGSAEDAAIEAVEEALDGNQQGYIVLIEKPDAPGKLFGPTEHSFSLEIEENKTQYLWSSKRATSNFGGSFVVDGKKDAEASVKYWQGKYPDYKFTIYNARDPERLPIVIDWQMWKDARKPANTLSGVTDKERARNLRFKLKEKE